jgi:S-phase kinase-associated protein 1
LATVPDEVLERILFYMTYHTTNGKTPDQIKEIAKPIRSLEMAKIVDDPEDAKFVDEMTYKQIFDCILAANYMQIDQLLHLLSAKVATLIKNKSHEEIRTIFQEGARATSASARAQS